MVILKLRLNSQPCIGNGSMQLPRYHVAFGGFMPTNQQALLGLFEKQCSFICLTEICQLPYGLDSLLLTDCWLGGTSPSQNIPFRLATRLGLHR